MVSGLTKFNWVVGLIFLICALAYPMGNNFYIETQKKTLEFAVQQIAERQSHYFAKNAKYVFFPPKPSDSKFKEAMKKLSNPKVSDAISNYEIEAFPSTGIGELVIRGKPTEEALRKIFFGFPFMQYDYTIKKRGGVGSGEWIRFGV